MSKRLWGAIARWTRSSGNNGDAILAAVIYGVGVLLLGALWGIDFGIELPARVLLAAAVLALVGLGISFLLGRRTATRSMRGELGRASASEKKLEAYSECLWQVALPSAEDDGKALAFAAQLVGRNIGGKVHLSLCRPESGGSLDGLWEPVHHPTHNTVEADDFRVSVDGSWIAHAQTVNREPGSVFGSCDMTSGPRQAEADLKAFRRHGSRSLLCCRLAFEMNGEKPNGRVGPCLVMLSDTAGAFTVAEESFLRELALLFGLRYRERRLMGQFGEGEASDGSEAGSDSEPGLTE